MLNPRSLRLAADGESIAAQISVLPYELGFKADQPGDHLLTVTLRPFADPSGTLTYFRVPDITSVGQPDGLVQTLLDGVPRFVLSRRNAVRTADCEVRTEVLSDDCEASAEVGGCGGGTRLGREEDRCEHMK